jgi:hypothetical protein
MGNTSQDAANIVTFKWQFQQNRLAGRHHLAVEEGHARSGKIPRGHPQGFLNVPILVQSVNHNPTTPKPQPVTSTQFFDLFRHKLPVDRVQ